MRIKAIATIILSGLALVSGNAFGGTTTIDFTQGIGNLVHLGLAGNLTTDSNCKAVLTGVTTWVVGNAGTPVTSGGTSSITVGIVPASDLSFTQEFGLILVDPDTQETVTATTDQSGNISLTNGLNTDTAFFPAPAAIGAAFTLEYNASTNTATVTVAGGSNSAVLSPAFLEDGGPAQFGVYTTTGAKFRSLTAVGVGIPNLTSTGTCGAGEGEGTTEGAALEGESTPTIITLGGGFIESGARLSLSLQGAAGALSYQWMKNGANLNLENSPTLVRDPVSNADEGTYRCSVNLGAKTVVISEPTLVTVVAPGSLPSAGVLGLSALAAVLALGGLLGSRRR